MVVSKSEMLPTALPKSIFGMKSRIWLTTFSFPMTNAVDKASTALAPQPLLLLRQNLDLAWVF